MNRSILLLAVLLAASAMQIETFYAVDPQQCIEEKCPTQWAACQKDSKCIPALQDCEKKCGTKQSCWSLCLPSKGSQAAIDVAKCAAANKCVGVAPSTALVIASPEQCIEAHCRDQLQACAKDPKCFAALQDCEKECLNNTSCFTTCVAKKGNANATNFWKCIVDNDCLNNFDSTAVVLAVDPEQCAAEKCPNQYDACKKDPKCIPALQDCEKKCGTKQSCWTFCLPTKGSSAAIDLAKCASANGCLGEVPSTAVAIIETPQQCIEEKCPTQWAACQKDPKCVPALEDCEKKCGTKASCWTLCLPGKGSQAAIDVAKCAQANGCDKAAEEETAVVLAVDPQQCAEEKCPNQYAACQKDSKCIPALQECEKKCGTKQSCWTLCLPTKGSQAAIDLAKCAAANGCLGEVPSTELAIATPQQCIEEKCPTQWAACQKDSKCVPALEDCEKKCGTKASCWTLCLPGKGSQAAIDVAKCAQANNCDKAAVVGSEQCYNKYCKKEHEECLGNWSCRNSMRKCLSSKTDFSFSQECLLEEAKEEGFLSAWYHCAGSHFCL